MKFAKIIFESDNFLFNKTLVKMDAEAIDIAHPAP